MPRHRFKDNRSREFEVSTADGGAKLFQLLPNTTDSRRPLRARLDSNPLRSSVVTALLQQIIDLSEPQGTTKRAQQLREAKARLAAQQDLLDELEWFGHKDGTKEFCCLWCDRLQGQGHSKGCRWLTATGRGGTL